MNPNHLLRADSSHKKDRSSNDNKLNCSITNSLLEKYRYKGYYKIESTEKNKYNNRMA